MKKMIFFFVICLVVLLTSCQSLKNESPYLGKWCIRGSWNWNVDTYFLKDSENSRIGYVTIDNFEKAPYEFMINNFGPNGASWWLRTQNEGIDKPIVFNSNVFKTGGVNKNAKFVSEGGTYTFIIDTRSGYPKVTVVKGEYSNILSK